MKPNLTQASNARLNAGCVFELRPNSKPATTQQITFTRTSPKTKNKERPNNVNLGLLRVIMRLDMVVVARKTF
jgi:hypothetical protein